MLAIETAPPVDAKPGGVVVLVGVRDREVAEDGLTLVFSTRVVNRQPPGVVERPEQLGIDRSRLAEVVGLGVDHAVVTTEAGGKRPFVTYGTVEDGDPATCDRAFEGDTMRASHRRWIGTHQ
jgi:hypothetical protein